MSRSSSIVELNLFPFLSVLVAVIGILMLNLVSVITTRVIGLEQGDGGDSSGEIDEAQYREIDNRVRQLEAQLVRNQKTCRQLAQTVRELDSLLQTREIATAAGLTAPKDVFPGLELASPHEVQIAPDPTRADRRIPIPVEVTAYGYVVHREGNSEQLPSLTQDDKPMRQFLQGLDRDRGKSYLLLLVHPDGVANYRLLRGLLTSEFGQAGDVERDNQRASRIDVGVEPFDRDWLLLPTTRGPS